MIRYFSLFNGIGGLEYGLEKSGIGRCVGFSEIKESSIRIYQRHYPDHRNFGDITKVSVEGLPEFDLLTGGFPCQSFSLAGLRRGFEDVRGKMIFYIYDVMRKKGPEFVVLENVKGLLWHNRGRTYRDVFGLLVSVGYFVRVVLLNSLYYGSAQSRERIFFLCRRGKDFGRLVPDIVDDMKRFRDVRDGDEGHYFYVAETEKNLKKIEQKDLYSFALVGGYDRVPTITTQISGGGGRNPSSQQKIVQVADGRFRYLTELEGERLQGFPDRWTEGENRRDRWFALGNAVNCDVSDYLFNNYLPKIWTDFQRKKEAK